MTADELRAMRWEIGQLIGVTNALLTRLQQWDGAVHDAQRGGERLPTVQEELA